MRIVKVYGVKLVKNEDKQIANSSLLGCECGAMLKTPFETQLTNTKIQAKDKKGKCLEQGNYAELSCTCWKGHKVSFYL